MAIVPHDRNAPGSARPSRRRFVRAAGALGLGVALAAGTRRRFAKGEAASVRIGALYNESGGLSSIDIPGLNGMRLAARRINANGGVLGTPLELIVIDGMTQPDVVAAAARDMIQRYDVVAIGGMNDSDSASAAGPVAQRLGVPLVTAGATLPTLPATIGDEYFMACYGDDTQAYAVADFARNTLASRSVWVLQDTESLYTVALARYFKERFTSNGGSIAGEDTYQTGDTDFATQLAHLQAMSPQPDVLFASALPSEAGLIVLQTRQAGINQPMISGDGFDTPEIIDTAGLLADAVYYATHVAYDNPNAAIQDFVAAYTAQYGMPPDTAFAALGYDTVNLIAAAIARAGSLNRSAVRDAIAATRNFPGVTGAINYAPAVRNPLKQVSIINISHGQAAFVRLV